MKTKIKITRFLTWTLTSKYRNQPVTHIEEHAADMLRYDAAFANPKYPNIVLTVRAQIGGRGLHKGEITRGRWDSFGYRIEEFPLTSPFLHADVLRDAGEWVTFHHPKKTNGATDYTSLAPLTLREWIDGGGD